MLGLADQRVEARPAGLRGEAPEMSRERLAGRLLTISETLHELRHRQDRAGRRAAFDELFGEGTDREALHLRVLELTEVVLQPLEVLDGAAERVLREQRAEQLEQVPKLLALLAKVVERFGRRVVVDGRPGTKQLAVPFHRAL